MILECKGLSKTYQGFPALSDVSFGIGGGHIVGLLGPSGSGKTTLIKLVAGLLSPSAGTISIQGNPVGPVSKSLVSYLPDHPYLDGRMKVRDMVRLFQDFYRDFEPERAYGMLETLGIDPRRKLKSFSKGTKEKVQLILVMSRRAKLYLLDEPIAGVDPAARDYILQAILSNYAEDASVLISTHLISDIENILDEVIFIQRGRIHTHAPVDGLRQESGKSVDALFREVFRC